MSRHHTVIFATGGITLSLELLASRILTPYFGVSLFIWTGILSITLVALAIGYWWGGWLAVRGGRRNAASLAFTFALLPSISCFSILCAALVYPQLFVALANFHLVLGSFLACSLLLLVPLVSVSAMNPLLVALTNAEDRSQSHVGDAGAGWVFFVSTIGSVLGVLITAFVLVPNVTNFRSLLALALALAMLAALVAWGDKRIESSRRSQLLALAVVGAITALILLVGATTYLRKDRTLTKGNGTFRLVYEKPTFFGNIKIVDSTIRQGGPPLDLRLYLADGLAQCVKFQDGEPAMISGYGMESVARGQIPAPNRILVLGLAGGILPMRFSAPGVDIDVVEINPHSVPIAEKFFGYDQGVASHHVMDARVYVRACEKHYDLIFADLFQGDATPEYLLTAEFMQDLAKCLAPQGGVVFNMVGHSDSRFEPALYSYLRTVNSAWPNLLLFHQGSDGLRNVLILASAASLDSFQPAQVSVPRVLQPRIQKMLVARSIDPQRLTNATLLTDDHNISSLQQAWLYLQTRGPVLRSLPAPLLVN